ncbi:MAG: alkaline phosphatase family protein [Taibaiella sp.]
MKKLFFTLTALALLSSVEMVNAQQQEKVRKVLFIGIDGVRSDALQQANTPVIDSLVNVGLYTFDSWHCGITSSGASWSDMMTGVWESKHRVTNNSYANADYNNYPYFIKRAKECRPDLKAIQVITWDQMNDPSANSNSPYGYVYNSGFDKSIDAGDAWQHAVTNSAIIQLMNPDLDVLFIHYDEVDGRGHGTGFDPNNPIYINQIQDIDAQIGEVLNALKSRPSIDDENWLILLSTDHGGIGLSHGGNANTERHIWWIAAGEDIPHLQITGNDPGSYVMGDNPVDTTMLKNTPVLTDIAVTALDHLVRGTGCGHPEENILWDLDGKSWLMTDTTSGPTYVEDVEDAAVAFGVYPNPNDGAFDIVFKDIAGTVKITIVNIAGQVVEQKMVSVKGDTMGKTRFDLKHLPKGLYSLQVQYGNKSTTRKMVLR